MKAWIELLGMDLEHIEFTKAVKSTLETYYKIQEYYDRQNDGYELLATDSDSD